MAVRLSIAFATSSKSWLNQQLQFDQRSATAKKANGLKAVVN
jgi:plasmid maintenance system antidote protein VapI